MEQITMMKQETKQNHTLKPKFGNFVAQKPKIQNTRIMK